MKHMKKLTALLLALLLCLCASVFAAEEELAGFYAASTVTVGGDEVPAGMLFDELSLQLEGDGTALLRVEGLATPFTWQFDGTSVLLNEYGGMVFLYEEGRLLFDEEGVLIAFEKEDGVSAAPADAGTPFVLPALTATEKASAVDMRFQLSDTLKDLLGEEFDMFKKVLEEGKINCAIAFADDVPVISVDIDLPGLGSLNDAYSVRNGCLYYTDLRTGKTVGIAIPAELSPFLSGVSTGRTVTGLNTPDTEALFSELGTIGMTFLSNMNADIGIAQKTVEIEGVSREVQECRFTVTPKGLAAGFTAIAGYFEEGAGLNRTLDTYLGLFGITPDMMAAAYYYIASDLVSSGETLECTACLEGSVPVLVTVTYGDIGGSFRLVPTEEGQKAVLELPGEVTVTALLGSRFTLTAEEYGTVLLDAFYEANGTGAGAGLSLPGSGFKADLVSSTAADRTNTDVTFTNGYTVSTLHLTKIGSSLSGVYTDPSEDLTVLLNSTKAEDSYILSLALTEDGETLTLNWFNDDSHWHLDGNAFGTDTLSLDLEKVGEALAGSLICRSEEIGVDIAADWNYALKASRFNSHPGFVKLLAKEAYYGYTLADFDMTVVSEEDADTVTLTLREIGGVDFGGSTVTMRQFDGTPISLPEATPVMVNSFERFVSAIGESAAYAA